jgi:hypothetical protein
MKEKMKGVVIVLLALILMPIYASAALLNVADNGQLMGASGVDVGGVLYDVSFQDGSCPSLYTGCDNASDDFIFTSLNDSIAASQALLDQVFVDGPHGAFDSDPELINGIVWAYGGIIFTPYGIPATLYPAFDTTFLWNYGDETNNVDGVFTTRFGIQMTTFPFPADGPDYSAFAVWVPSQPEATVPTPEPSTLLLLSSGLAGLAFTRRKFKGR